MKNLRVLVFLLLVLPAVSCRTRDYNGEKIAVTDPVWWDSLTALQQKQLDVFNKQMKKISSSNQTQATLIYYLLALDKAYGIQFESSSSVIVPKTLLPQSIVRFARRGVLPDSEVESYEKKTKQLLAEQGQQGVLQVKYLYFNILSSDQTLLGNLKFTWDEHKGAPSFLMIQKFLNGSF